MSFTSIIGREQVEEMIPVEASTAIIRGAYESSVAMQLMRRIPMSSREATAPVLSESVSAFWVKEGGLKETTSFALEGAQMYAEELAAIAIAEANVVADAAFDIWTALRPEFSEAIAQRLDQATLAGTDRPSSWTASVLEGAVEAGHVIQADADAAAGGSWDDLAALLDVLEGRGVNVTGYLGALPLRGRLRRQRDVSGQLTGPALDLSSAWGVDVAWDRLNVLPEGVLALAGEWPLAVIGLRQDMNLEMFDTGVISDEEGRILANLLQEDRVACRLTFRAGYTAVSPLRRSAGEDQRPFPFAVLVEPGFEPPEARQGADPTPAARTTRPPARSTPARSTPAKRED
jgi:Phage capsid family